MTTKKNAKRNASQTYADRRADVNAMIGRLCDELVKFDRRAEAAPLDYVRTTLIDLVEGLSGTDRADIERDLNGSRPERKRLAGLSAWSAMVRPERGARA